MEENQGYAAEVCSWTLTVASCQQHHKCETGKRPPSFISSFHSVSSRAGRSQSWCVIATLAAVYENRWANLCFRAWMKPEERQSIGFMRRFRPGGGMEGGVAPYSLK